MAADRAFSVNTARIDPYKNFKFIVSFAGIGPVAAVSKVSALKRTTEIVSHRDGGDLSTPRHSPGRTSFQPITLERGVTFSTAFEEWANLVYSTQGDGAVSLAGYKREIIIAVLNLQHVVVKQYKIFRAWVSEYTALPDLDANANATMIESVVVQNEGFERDDAIVEVPEK
jgi:phage tail-like protein